MLLGLLGLLLLDELVLDHPLYVLWVVLGDISDALAARPHEPLQCQVVARGQRVVLISLDQATGMLARPIIERILVKDYL